MRFRLVTGLALVVALGVTVSLGAQQTQIRQGQGQGPGRPGGPARDAQAEEKTGTAVIKGKVLAAETNAPIRRAQVRLMSPELRGGRVATSDPDGRFEFRDLPKGRYTLNASKAGFVSMQYGQRRAFEQGKPIEMLDAQVMDTADFRLPRGSAITGRILDEFGEPVADAMVQAMQYQYVGGQRQLMPTGRGGQTNDLGQYRIYGLSPGDYIVSAAVAGMGGFEMEVSLSGGRGETTSYAPTYYPGTQSPADAQRLAVAIGQEASSVDFALLPVRTARITGIVLDSEGKPVVNGMVMLLPREIGGMMLRIGSNAGRTNKDGAFAISNVAPGEYTLNVRGGAMFFEAQSGAGGAMTVTATAVAVGEAGAGAPRPEPEFAVQPITVAGQDITGVTLITGRGGRMTGRVVFADGQAPDRSLWENMRVSARPAEMMVGPMMSNMPSPVAPDGTFDLRGISGNVLVRPVSVPAGWTLQAVEYNGQDVTDAPIEFKGTEEASGVRIRLTSQTTEVSGAVTNDRGQPERDYTVVVFADDSAKWGPMTRFVSVGRPDQDGRYKVRNLPPTDYLAIALDYVQQGEWSDPAFLERMKSRATSFKLGAGETRAVDLKLQVY
jgi:protocatechuate 3,4-dioxygenase beta subunit